MSGRKAPAPPPPAAAARRNAAQRQRAKRTLPTFGVALADILANGVAIVIIMIVVTSMSRYQQEQDRLARTEDVSLLLSRELATSVVMNALPTSAPAQLHDYVASPLDRNPHPGAMPILELHDGFVRDHYTGTVYARTELLRPANALDDYLASLAPEQLAATRVDVYGIREFYVAMSIFKAHGLTPRHWHFLADQRGGGSGAAGDEQRPAALAAQRRDRPPLPPRMPTASLGSGIDTAPTAIAAGAFGTLPADVALARQTTTGGAYPQDGLAPRADARSGTWPGAPAADGAQPLAAGPAAMSGKEAPGASGPRFRTAVPTADSASITTPAPPDMTAVLRALFAFMQAEQKAADAHLPSRLATYDFQRHVLDLLPTLPPATDAETRTLRSLRFLLDHPRPRPADAAMPLRHMAAPELPGQAFVVFANEPLPEALWLRGPDQGPPPPTPAAQLSLQLGSHAAIHEGLRVPLPPDAILMLPPSPPDPTPRWRVVTLVNPMRDDFVTGFVFAAVDALGRLTLPVDQNAIAIGGRRIESQFPAVAYRPEASQLLLYGGVALLFAAGAVLGWGRGRAADIRRTATQPPVPA